MADLDTTELADTWCECSDGLWYDEPSWRWYDGTGRLLYRIDLETDGRVVLRIVTNDVHIKSPEVPSISWFTTKVKNGRLSKAWVGKKHRIIREFRGRLTRTPPPPQHYRRRDERPNFYGGLVFGVIPE